jgi:hypothetical protein
MAAKRLSLKAFGAITLIAASSAWLTGGALTVTSSRPGAERLGLAPAPAWLAVWLVAGCIAFLATRSTSRRFALLLLSGIVLTPWLLGAVPAALYIWNGPLRIWLWAVLLAGLFLPAVIRRAPSWLARTTSDPRRAPWLAAALAAVAYLAGAWQVFPQLPTGDEPHYLVIAQSLVKDHDLQIENNHRRGDYHDYYAGDLRPDYLQRGLNGEIYSVHAPGLSVIVAPVLALFGYPGVLVFLALVSAWATALTWTATWRVTSDAAASWFGWATAALSAPFFFQSFVVYPDAPGAALVMVGVLALVDDRPLSTRRIAATGAALALLPWLHTRYAAAAVMLGLMLCVRLGSIRRIAALLSIPLVSAAGWFAFFYAIYGSPDPRGPYGGSTQSDMANLGRGLVGLLFDQQFGVLPAAPVLLCALAGIVVLLRRSLRLAMALLLLVTPYGLVVSTYQMWWGGNSSPGRFVIPILLPLAIPAGVWFQTRRGHTGRLLGLGALTVSLLTTITLAGVDRGTLLYNFRDGSSRLLTWLSPLVNITTGFPSVFQTTPSDAFLHGLVWLAAVALTAAAGIFAERRGAGRTPVALSVGLAAIVTSAIALSIVWRDHGVGPTMTPAAATAALLRTYDPDSRQIAIRYSPIRRVRARDLLTNLTLAEAGADPVSHEAPAITLFRLPAGVYAVEGTGGTGGTSQPPGPLTVTVDGEFGPQWTFPLGPLDDSAAPWRREFSLPAPVRALAVKAATGHIVVRPVSVAGSHQQFSAGFPEHAARYGPAVVFLVDGQAFMEAGGTWVEGGRSADFVVSADAGAPVRLLVRNPPVSNVVTLEGDGWRQYFVLAPGEERTTTLPFPPGSPALKMRVTAAHGARPAEFERGSTDTRFLGCWIETQP